MFLIKVPIISPVHIRLRFLLFLDFPWNLFLKSISHLLPSRSKAILSNRLNPAVSNSALLSLSSFRNLECILYIPGDLHFIYLFHNLFNFRLLFRWVPCQEGFWFGIFPVPSTATTNGKGSLSLSVMTSTSLSTLLCPENKLALQILANLLLLMCFVVKRIISFGSFVRYSSDALLCFHI